MKIRCLIVDDEPLARQNLLSLLDTEPDIEVIGACADGASALLQIERHQPELLFLDVQMPMMNGFEVLAASAQEQLPVVIFVTAHDQFAVRAFEAQAVDYLLKPFHRERFHAALDRVRRHLAAQRAMAASRATAGAAATERMPDRMPDRMMIKTGDRVVFLRFDQLDFVQADSNYVRIHAADKVHIVREKISALEKQLPAAQFLRVHRSYIINLASVVELIPDGNGDWIVVLHTGRHIPVGPSYPDAIHNALRNAGVQVLGGSSRLGLAKL